MPTYLIRRRDEKGQFVHIDSTKHESMDSSEMNQQFLERNYGYGLYSVLIAMKGVQGLTSFGNFLVAPKLHFKGLYPRRQTLEDIQALHGPGSYLIARISNTFPIVAIDTREIQDYDFADYDALSGLAPSIKGWGVFKVPNV